MLCVCYAYVTNTPWCGLLPPPPHTSCPGLNQALLEFHLFQPPPPPGGTPALLRLFAAFWDAAVPRIGQPGARGWAYWACWAAMGLEQPAAATAGVQEQQEQEEQEQLGSGGGDAAGTYSGGAGAEQQAGVRSAAPNAVCLVAAAAIRVLMCLHPAPSPFSLSPADCRPRQDGVAGLRHQHRRWCLDL